MGGGAAGGAGAAMVRLKEARSAASVVLHSDTISCMAAESESISVRLPRAVMRALDVRADLERRSRSNQAAFLLAGALAEPSDENNEA